MQPADLALITSVSDPQIHPDGQRIAFVVTTIDLDDDRYRSSLWMWDGEARQLTFGSGDSAPRWSPDGRYLAFLRKGTERTDPQQLAIMPSDGGEARVVTSFELGARAPVWSPDGSRLMVVATEWFGEWAELDKDERARRPRRITGFEARLDNQGWLHDRRGYAYVVDPSGETEPSRVGSSAESESGLAWSPDGARVAMVTHRDNPRLLEEGIEVVEVDLASGAETLHARRSGYYLTDYDPSGALYGIGGPTPDYPYVFSLWRLGEPPVDLTGHIDRSINGLAVPSALETPIWLDDGFLCSVLDRGRGHIVEFDSEGNPSTVLDGDRYITGLSKASSGRLAFTATDPTCPGELYERTPNGEERRLTQFNKKIRSGGGLVRPGFFQTESAPGVDVDTWVFVPEGDGPFPVLLNIHGGPASEYGYYFFDEFQIYVSAGYAVVAANPRGSEGRGLEWLRAVTGPGWGVVDMEDITAVIDEAIGRDARLDPSRVGIMGGSYGGFLTAWAIARDGRYQSAIVERALIDWESFGGTSDINRDFSGLYLHPATADDHEALWEASPLASAGRVTTPTLIIHSENDLRCPIGQAEQFFTALLRNGVEVEMLRFPDEGHELSRSGAPRHRVERFEQILAWHDHHLGTASSSRHATREAEEPT
ncbi:MAG: S9 family peptidase [bacterium]|nr:S9 family peptidase [Acidimicrobiia bacterium]MCY4650706.1 S9 family peptidase [bacterium]